MLSNNSKYSNQVREDTAKYIIESGKSSTSISEGIGIDENTVCRGVRYYRRKCNLPTYAEEKEKVEILNLLKSNLRRKCIG
ncbi:hypothetical protein [Terrisporobacter mayombei]|uniref:Transposase n=1 Tax=Terrisporobacter mayombei TaxID=1541 RepID=A0ABY9Q6V6_9FIRM|nr:hypothetical protein [Terrisporobacter mayombei]MCC3868901.1 hypothetical protein [Terrisporobacter mayombei]WMT82965.1 hypothetical protein TEMA_34630 [Terrisporobacter mayombei]